MRLLFLVLFLDLHHDGTLDSGDPTATTDANGHFTLSGALAGTPVVLEVVGQDGQGRYVVDQTVINADGSVDIGAVPVSTIAPVPVVLDPPSASPHARPNTAYVQSLYLAVLGRNGSSHEVARWVAKLTGGMTRREVAADFINSREHRKNEVAAYYQEFFDQAPGQGASSLVKKLRSGASEEKVVEQILNSRDYQSAHQNPALFIQDLYIEVLGSQGTPSDVAGWEAALASGTSRKAVVADFVRSTAAIDQVVDSFHAAYLHSQPQPGTPTVRVNPHMSASVLATNILSSPEFYKNATTSKG